MSLRVGVVLPDDTFEVPGWRLAPLAPRRPTGHVSHLKKQETSFGSTADAHARFPTSHARPLLLRLAPSRRSGSVGTPVHLNAVVTQDPVTH